MSQIYSIISVIMLVLIGAVIGCSRTTKPSVDDGDEESGTELALNETYDKVRNGARLILNYYEKTNAFKGTVENTTDETLKQVRVEVHLSNGKELGPTPVSDLKPGEKRDIELKATSTDFDGWTAHPEVGSEEHSNGEHGDSEHDREGDSEHDGKGGGEHK